MMNVWDPVSGSLLRSGSGEETQWALTDALDSITGLVSNPASTGKMDWHASYDEFGQPMPARKFDPSFPQGTSYFGFTGEPYDFVTGLNYLRNRYYAPSLGRFTSPDPLGAILGDASTLNGYGYVMNNPLKWVDPWGLSPESSIDTRSSDIVLQTQALPNDRFFSTEPWSNSLVAVSASLPGPFDPNKLSTDLMDLAKGLVQFLLGAAKSGLNAAGALFNSLVHGLSTRFHVSPIVVAGVLTTIVTTFGTSMFDLISPRAQTSDEILPYSEAAKITAEQSGALQAHHLIEVRHLRSWDMEDRIGDAPSVVMTKEEHERWTRTLLRKLPKGQDYTGEEVYEAYKEVYRDKPEWLEAIRRFMNWK